MESILVRANFDDLESSSAKAFARDLRDTLNLDRKTRNACLGRLVQIVLARTSTQEHNFIEQLAEKLQEDPLRLLRVFGIMKFLLAAFRRDEIPDTDPPKWANDFVELEWVNENTRPVFEDLLKCIKEDILDKVNHKMQCRKTAAGVLPSFSGCAFTVELRPVKDNNYRWGMLLDEYNPRITGITPVVSASISVDEGTPKTFYFQADEEEIDHLITTLQATKKDLAELMIHLGLKNHPRENGYDG